jgi:hypothetical protein
MELEQKFSIESSNLKQAIFTYDKALSLKESSKYSDLELDLNIVQNWHGKSVKYFLN